MWVQGKVGPIVPSGGGGDDGDAPGGGGGDAPGGGGGDAPGGGDDEAELRASENSTALDGLVATPSSK